MEETTTYSKQRRRQVGQAHTEGNGRTIEMLLTGLLLLGITFICAVVLVASIDIIDGKAWTVVGVSLEELLHLNKDPEGVIRISLVVGSALFGLLALAVLFRKISGGDRQGLPHLLAADEKGMVMVETESICTVVTATALRVPGVMDASVRVVGTWASPVQLKVKIWLSPFADHKDTGEQVRDRASEAVTRLVGLDVQDCQVSIKTIAPKDMGRMLE